MRIWIDAEWDGTPDRLLSMGLAAEDDRNWYWVFSDKASDPWVKENVLPQLFRTLQSGLNLQRFLYQYSDIHLIADWPQDIAIFCQQLILAPGIALNTPPITMEIRRDLSSAESAIPHNALADAIAIKEMHLKLEGKIECAKSTKS